MIVFLIRHGKTKGNLEKRYIGSTDDPILAEETDHLKEIQRKLFAAYADRFPLDAVYSSPMLRCRQTAKLLFPDTPLSVVSDLKEMNFGRFEYKNYSELNGDPDYQKWIDSGGTLPFPEGESRQEFEQRTVDAFLSVLRLCREKKQNTIALTVHGGTIMSILHRFGYPERDYFDWQTENGSGYVLETDTRETDPERIKLIYRETIR